jgi:hypothetical protein
MGVGQSKGGGGMSAENALFNVLSNDPVIASMITSGGVARMFPVTAPQDAAFPFAVYQRIGTERLHGTDGATGTVRADVQVSFYADTFDQARSLADRARLALDAYPPTTVAGISVDRIWLISERDAYDAPQSSAEIGIYSVQQDYSFWFTEATTFVS